MDKGFERCCDLIARMIEKYGGKMLQEMQKEDHLSFNNGKRITKEGNPDMLLITSWCISLKKKRHRINRSMYKANRAAW